MEHTAEISKPQSEERILKGEFTYENGKLSFLCHTQNVEFPEVLEAITAMRDELQRQIDNQTKCPFHTLKKDEEPAIPESEFDYYCRLIEMAFDKTKELTDQQSSELKKLMIKYNYNGKQ